VATDDRPRGDLVIGKLTARDLKRFRTHMIVDRGVGAVCADGYRRCIVAAARRMGGRQITPAAARQQILWMRENGYSYSHVVNTSLAFEHYCAMRGGRLKLGRPRKPRHIVSGVLSEAEISRLIQSATSNRQRAIAALLAYSGVRNAELCHMTVSDVDLGANTIRVRGGKGVKDRIVHISAECTKVVLNYLAEHPREPSAFLFTTLVHDHALATGDVRKILHGLERRARIGRRVYPHLLRHSLATNLLGRGASLMLIKEQLGHAFIDSTMIYVGAAPARLRSEYDFFKPAYI